MKNRHFLYILFISFLVASCAQILAPTGGPKDVQPPLLLSSSPENKALNITNPQFVFTFDEFFTLQNPNDKILISPPLNSNPEFKIKGKSLIINISDTLKQNTTYSFVFSDCIKDITENNTLANFTFLFSTGNFLDSNIIQGKVINAETLEAEKNVFVLLYKNSNDSLPRTEKPYYITKTNETGYFYFPALSEFDYSIYALNDKNNNLIFDQIKEPFAFENQTIKSSLSNSLNEKSNLILRLFTHADSSQKILRTLNLAKGVHAIVFKSQTEKVNIQSLTQNISPNRFLTEWNKSKDTLTLFDTQLTSDTISFLITDVNFSDTIHFITQKEVQRKFGKKNSEDKKYLNAKLVNADELYKPTYFEFDYPLNEIKTNRIQIIKNTKDTIWVNLKSNNDFPRRVYLDFIKEEKTKYSIVIPDSAFIGVNGLENDTLKQNFVVKAESDYGNFIVNLKYKNTTPVIVILTDDKGNIIQETLLSSQQILEFKHLLPSNYRLFFILDNNKNGKWDTGNFSIKLQPEIKIELSKKVLVKANWDIEEEIDLDKSFNELIR